MYKLKVGDSKIPGAGHGIFADEFISSNQMIIEYEGYRLPSRYSQDELEKSLETENGIIIVGYGLAAYINDIVDVNGLAYWEPTENIPAHKTLAHNCKFLNVPQKGGMFIVSTRDIKPGEELYIPYGKPYWIQWKKNHLDSK